MTKVQSIWRRFIASMAVIAVATLPLAAGCHSTFAMRALGCSRTGEWPRGTIVHPYLGLPDRPLQGPLVVIYLATSTDLSDLAPRRSHRLYFEVIPCSQDAHGPGLFNGPVFLPGEVEVSALRDVILAGEHVYKVLIPLNLKAMEEYAGGYGTLQLEPYIETARRDGLCIRVGGAEMWGMASLFSNLVPALLQIQDHSLLIAPSAPRF